MTLKRLGAILVLVKHLPMFKDFPSILRSRVIMDIQNAVAGGGYVAHLPTIIFLPANLRNDLEPMRLK